MSGELVRPIQRIFPLEIPSSLESDEANETETQGLFVIAESLDQRKVGPLQLDEVEGILNSRPLTPISNDSDCYDVLTPGHFLIGRSIQMIPEPMIIDVNENRLSRWQRTTKVVQIIWKKWSNGYLGTLQQRNKWMIEKDNISVGTMVLVKEDYLPICKWILGRVIKVYHGSDNK
ncbi:uncharacterized protein LOC118190397 [Stegodyphus dumicola]|uniref:uncharacterized protein LOC118190397 n=1 Tax=Stegodyphus dumicola TaxID=202533 RepID=UPI0015AF8C7C|nr:uncharacterized protein LOC118190397 [Stegodyphus dumicola]